MAVIDLKIYDNLTPKLEKVLKRSKDMSVPMAMAESVIMRRLRRRAWMGSGLHRRTGKLFSSTKTWHGKKSVGVSGEVNGRTKATPIGFALSRGLKKASGGRHGNRRHRVRAYSRRGRRVKAHSRFMISPWGNIPARPFIPERMPESDNKRIMKFINEYLAEVGA